MRKKKRTPQRSPKTTVIVTDKNGEELEYCFPKKTAKQRARKLLKDSYEPGYFGEQLDSAEAENGSWMITIDSDLVCHEH